MIQLVKRVGAEGRLAAANIAVGLIIALGVFRLAPVRSLWIDIPAVAAMVLLAVASVAVVRRLPWAPKIVRATAILLLTVGALVCATLTLGATFSRAVVASSAAPGPSLYFLIALVVLPYTVGYGIGLLAWLGARESR